MRRRLYLAVDAIDVDLYILQPCALERERERERGEIAWLTVQRRVWNWPLPESTRARISFCALLSDSLSSFFARRSLTPTPRPQPSPWTSPQVSRILPPRFSSRVSLKSSSSDFVIIGGHEIALQYVNKVAGLIVPLARKKETRLMVCRL